MRKTLFWGGSHTTPQLDRAVLQQCTSGRQHDQACNHSKNCLSRICDTVAQKIIVTSKRTTSAQILLPLPSLSVLRNQISRNKPQQANLPLCTIHSGSDGGVVVLWRSPGYISCVLGSPKPRSSPESRHTP